MSDFPIGSWRIRAHIAPYQPDSVSLYAQVRTGVDTVAALESTLVRGAAPVLTTSEPNSIVSPAFNLQREGAQALMDSLWDCGLRPTQGHASEGAIGATKQHLADMRALVSHFSKAKLA